MIRRVIYITPARDRDHGAHIPGFLDSFS